MELAAEALHKKEVALATQREKLDIIRKYVDEAHAALETVALERTQIHDNIENIEEQRRAAEADREGLEEGNFATQEDIRKTQETLSALRAKHAEETERAAQRRIAPVSYTHLDVYKRQVTTGKDALCVSVVSSGNARRFTPSTRR